MLTTLTDGFLCCLLGKTPNSVTPLDTVESRDGFTFLEVKPGRILRIRHSVRDSSPTEPTEEPTEPPRRAAVHCRRRITLYRNGQLLIENLGDSDNADRDQDANAELEIPDHPGIPTKDGAKRRKRKPKKVVMVDCEKRITSCKGTHRDVVLFFIHGVGGSLDIWKEQLEFFEGLGYEVVAPDLAGHGCSSAPPVAAAYTFYALAEDVRAVFKRYAKKRNILVGHSYGVSFCTFLAHEYPELVHKVIMINGGGPTALEPSLCSIFNLPPCVLHCLSPCLAWSFLKAGFARQGAKEKQLLREGNAFNVSSFVLRAMMSGQYWPEGDELYHAELAVPVLLVHGMHDKFVPVEEDQRMAEILLIAFLKVIDEGSHMVMLECPDTVNTLLHEFVLWEPDTPDGDGDTK
ncbi:protein ABHD8 [Catharus ustulatus]|uniref:protein ABHD8 n=1 Tax=Catharus ustulatus TaxID=91951 RepID=UPI00140C0018|nr:protein ABHD8 [Catharus ustulatus]